MGKHNEHRVLNLLREKNKALQRKIERLRKQLNQFKSEIDLYDDEVDGLQTDTTTKKETQYPERNQRQQGLPRCEKCGGELQVIEIARRKIEKCLKCGEWKKIGGSHEKKESDA